MSVQQNKKEFIRFIITGLSAVGVDLITYYLLMDLLTIDTAKAIGFIAGSIVAFFLNKIWTFENTSNIKSSAIQFSLLYTITFFANVTINHLTLLLFSNLTLLAFLAATATSTILNFIGMKFWVFKVEPSMNEQG